jgi:hypothetical protein
MSSAAITYGANVRPRVSGAQAIAYCLPAFLLAGSSIVLRETGGASQIIALLALLPLVLFKSRVAFGFSKWQLVFFFNTTLLVLLSYVDALPTPWTFARDFGLVFRQSYTLLLTPLIVYAFGIYIRALIENGLLGATAAIYGLAIVVEYFVFLGARQAVGLDLGSLSIVYGLPNNTAMFAVTMVALLHFNTRPRYRNIFLGFLALNVASAGMQNLLVAVAAVLIMWTKRPFTIFYGLLLALVGTTFISYAAFTTVYAIDVNTAARAVWAVNGLREWIANAPFGFGFGVPALEGLVYSGGRSFEMSRDLYTGETGYYLIGHHNSFVGVFFRVGLIGGLAFLAMMAVALPRADTAAERTFGMLAVLLLIALYLNVAVESPTYVFGVCYAIAMAINLRRIGGRAPPPAMVGVHSVVH